MSAALPGFAIVADEWFDGERRHAGAPTTMKVATAGSSDTPPATMAPRWRPRAGGAARPFLMPGLVDAHVHLFLDGGPPTSPRVRRT
jgi:cytosine/adenosine deaminase-related metal-dependent hydrolase